MKKKNSAFRKERLLMLSATAFVLTALTMTGVYMREKKNTTDEYRLDLSQLDSEGLSEKTEEIVEQNVAMQGGTTIADDLDADPDAWEVDANDVEAILAETLKDVAEKKENVTAADAGEAEAPSEEAGEEEEEAVETAGGAKKADFNFPMNQHLTWPVVGEILMNYSMDKTVLFKTLGQYRYNPALIIGATEGKEVLAAANGVCVRTEKTTELGNTMVFDLGDGYELTYGQLETITMKVGDVMKEGDVIGTVGTPSIYYAQEGANLYMKLTKDGVPVNPMNVLD